MQAQRDGRWSVRRVRWDAVRHGVMSRRIYNVLLRWTRYANEQYEVWNGRPNCGHFFGGSYWYASETVNTCFALALVSSLDDYDAGTAGISREQLRRRVVSAIRYSGFTHDAGPEDCVRTEGSLAYVSGKKWGGEGENFFMSSQNGRSVALLVQSALLLWDELDAETRLLVQNAAVHYADRWSDEEPRNGSYFDTQCEENAWTAAGIAAAVALFADHPRKKKWESGFRRWALNALTTPADRGQSPHGLIDGLQERQIRTVTFHPDFTTENHGFVHPSYMCAGINLRAFHLVLSFMTGQSPDEAALVNNENLYERAVKYWTQFDGMIIPVQGQDWWYNRHHDSLITHAVLSIVHGNRDAARFERNAIEVIEGIQASNSRGCLLEERGEECVINADHGQFANQLEHSTAYELAMSCVLHLFGGEGAEPSAFESLERSLCCVREYPFGGVVVHRTAGAFSSFSWRNHVMCVTLPRKGMWSVTPIYQSMVGTVQFRLPDAEDSRAAEPFVPNTERRYIDVKEDGFVAVARIVRGSCKLRQDIVYCSLPDGRSVYMERMKALQRTEISEIATGMVGIRNERYSALPELAPGKKTLYLSGGGEVVFEGFYGREPDRTERFEALDFVNVDDEIGYLLFGSSGIRYLNKHVYPKWRGVEDVLTLNCREGAVLDEGEALPPFVVVILPNRTAEMTEDSRRRSFLLECLADDAVVLETEGTLVYSNFGGAQSIVARKRCEAGVVHLFEGEQWIRGNTYTWQRRVDGFRSGYLQHVGQMNFPEVPEDVWIHISGDGCVTMLNRSPNSVQIELAAGASAPRSVLLRAGECVQDRI